MTAHRTLLFATVAALLAASACVALGRWGCGALPTLIWEGHREGALDHRLSASDRVLENKTRLVNDLIVGRTTLHEVALRFAELNGVLTSDGNDELVGAFQATSGEEGLCQNVLLWAENQLWHQRDQDAAAVFSRLQAEYRDRFGHDPERAPVLPPGRSR
jgi:hypothetical protein